MITVAAPGDDAHRLADLLAGLRRRYAGADGIDPHSTLEQVPTTLDLASAFRDADLALVAYRGADDVAGYGVVWSWSEDDGTSVHLLDPWAVPGPDRRAVEDTLFTTLEAAVRQRLGAAQDVVLGANSRPTEPGRAALLAQLGYRPVFTMVEMQLTGDLARRPPPAGISVRLARPEDAPAVGSLTARVWAGRPYFTSPAAAAVEGWLATADPELFLLAEHGADLVGLVSARITPRQAEIDDVQVDPRWQRRGVATHLLSELVDRLRARTDQPIRLHTEGHDPAGARSLYERLGFVVVATHGRHRKRLPPGVTGQRSRSSSP